MWISYRFSQFVDINPVVKLKQGEKYSFVEMKDIDGKIRYCDSLQERMLSGGSRFADGDTLFARITPCLENGKIAQVRNLKNGIGFGSTEFLIFRGKKDISDSDFIFYLSKWDEVRDFAEINLEGTSGRQRVNKDCFSGLKLSLPPLAEQKAIAAVLGSLDDKIDLLHRQNATLERMAETLFRQWFIEDAQEGWDSKPLTYIANFLNGLACQKFPPQNDIDKLPVLKIRELNNGISEDSDFASSGVGKEYIIHAGDVIFSWSGSLLVKIWHGEDCILNQHLFKVYSSLFPKWFYYFWCKHHLLEFSLIAESHATTMGHIKRRDLEDAEVLVPDKGTLENMTKIIAPLFEKLLANTKQIRTLEKLRDTLLPKLMSGEVRVRMAE